MARPKKEKGQNGGARVGAGRPKGSTNIYSQKSIKKLENLGFDPIEKMVEKFEEIQLLLEDSTKYRPGTPAHASLLSTQQKLLNDLMPYGYRKVPEKSEVETINKKPLAITLTSKNPSKEVSEESKE